MDVVKEVDVMVTKSLAIALSMDELYICENTAKATVYDDGTAKIVMRARRSESDLPDRAKLL